MHSHKASTFYNNSIYIIRSTCDNLITICKRDLDCETDKNNWKQIMVNNGKYTTETYSKRKFI